MESQPINPWGETNVISVTLHLLGPAIWGDIWNHIFDIIRKAKNQCGNVYYWMNQLDDYIRGAFRTIFWPKLGFCPNRLDPSPPPLTLGQKKTKFFLMFILHFRLFWAFYFFVKNFIFFGWDDKWGANTIMNWWNIVPPVMYYVFHHISGHLT